MSLGDVPAGPQARTIAAIVHAICGLLVLLPAAAASGCASGPKGPVSDPISGAIQQPFRDLNLVRDDIPPVLIRAAAAPYGPDAVVECAALARAIAELDIVLGVDLDGSSQPNADNAQELASDALRGALGLPLRGIVRRITGAERRDRELRHAVLSGMVRRGYLKGIARAQGC